MFEDPDNLLMRTDTSTQLSKDPSVFIDIVWANCERAEEVSGLVKTAIKNISSDLEGDLDEASAQILEDHLEYLTVLDERLKVASELKCASIFIIISLAIQGLYIKEDNVILLSEM